jgi:hypothetical protein
MRRMIRPNMDSSRFRLHFAPLTRGQIGHKITASRADKGRFNRPSHLGNTTRLCWSGKGRTKISGCAETKVRGDEGALYFSHARPVLKHRPDANPSRLSRRQQWLKSTYHPSTFPLNQTPSHRFQTHVFRASLFTLA